MVPSMQKHMLVVKLQLELGTSHGHLSNLLFKLGFCKPQKYKNAENYFLCFHLTLGVHAIGSLVLMVKQWQLEWLQELDTILSRKDEQSSSALHDNSNVSMESKIINSTFEFMKMLSDVLTDS